MTAVPGELGHLGPVPGSGRADIATHIVAGKIVGIDAAVFQRAPGHPQRYPLLWVHRDGLARRDTEEFRIECCCPAEESTAVMDLLESTTT